MRNQPSRKAWFITIAILSFASGVFAQRPDATVKAKTEGAPKTTSEAGKADITGVWYARGLSATIFSKGDALMTPWAKDKLAHAKASFGPKAATLAETDDPVYKCYPPGVPRVYFHPFPVQIAQIPGQMLMLFEYDHTVRHIYTDGRKHPEDGVDSWMGNSIGHWEGDTFVVDSTGFNDRSWLDRLGHAHSDQLHVIERFKRTSPEALEVNVTIEDPKAYTKPFDVTFAMRLEPKWDIGEEVCPENMDFSTFESSSPKK